MRTGVSLSVTSADMDRLRNLVKDRNAPQKHVWRAQIVLLSAEGVGTNAIMRETGKAKTCVWRWQERFAAEGVLDGTVIGRNMQRHRHQEFIRFLNTIEADIPAGKIIHVVLDNYATHKHAKVRAWLDRHPRFVFHYTPTSASWLNAVEGFFAKLTNRRLKRGAFCSIVDLQAAINRFLKETNDDPKPFVWTADPDKIIAAVRRGYQTLDLIR